MGKFGDKFRKERERQGIKLEDVSNATKISSRMLRAIEDEHFDQLPGGVFNKGFIRTYAKHLGLDDEESVAAYLATMNPQNGHAGNATTPPSVADRRTPHSGERWHGRDRRGNDRRHNDRRHSSDPLADELPDLQLPKAEHVRPRRKMAVHSDSGGIPWTVSGLVLAIVAGAILWSHFRNARPNILSPAPSSIAPSPISPAVTNAPASGNDDAAKATASPPSSVAKTALRSTSQTSSAKSPSSSQSPSAGGASIPADARKEEARPSTDADSSPPTPKPHANLFLIIRASENSWISVAADGQPVIQETLIAPAHASVSARREIAVRAGNAAGVTYSLNGQEFPTQGAEGEVKTLIFDTSGMHPAAPLAAPATPGAATVPPTDPTQ